MKNSRLRKIRNSGRNSRRYGAHFAILLHIDKNLRIVLWIEIHRTHHVCFVKYVLHRYFHLEIELTLIPLETIGFSQDFPCILFRHSIRNILHLQDHLPNIMIFETFNKNFFSPESLQ